MKTRIISFVALWCVMGSLPTAPVFAFEATDSAAHQLTPNTFLFTVDYEFGYLNAEAALPIEARATAPESTTKPNLFFSLIDSLGNAVDGGELMAVILSDAPVVNGYYHIPQGKRTDFTLLVLYRTNAPAQSAPATLRVTQLGNVVRKSDELSYLEANDQQLADYRAELHHP